MFLASKEKKERALGTRLLLKGDRCNSPKCVMVRRPHRPGMHGKKRRRPGSEFASQLAEKQKIRFSYGLREAHMEKLFKEALGKSGAIGETVVAILERQLANVVFRLGFAPSRIVARQLVGHGHILVNGKRVTIPSYAVRPGEVISIKPTSRDLLIFKELPTTLKKYDAPTWLALDKEKCEGKVLAIPRDTEIPFDINLVVDYYSK